MATHLSVPGDVEPTSMIDLVNDCRELVGAVGSLGVTAVSGLVRIPRARRTERGAMPVDISSQAAGAVDGYEDYGS